MIVERLAHNPGISESDHECLNFKSLTVTNRISTKVSYQTIRWRLRYHQKDIATGTRIDALQGEILPAYNIEKLGEPMKGYIPKPSVALHT